MRCSLFIVILVLSASSLSAQVGHKLRDENGRHVIGRGFVVVTNNSYFTSDDYTRMSRLDNSLVLCHDPLETTGFEVFKFDGSSNPADFIWDNDKQQLIVLKWPIDHGDVHMRIIPGINN